MPKAKPYTGPVDETVARQLLNSTGHSVEIGGEKLLLGDALISTANKLKELVKTANQELEGNPFAAIIAEHLATTLNRRGKSEVAVNEDGSMQLYVNYKNNPRTGESKRVRNRKVPLMSELKARAEKLGVEIPEELGIKRSKINEYLNKVAELKKRKAAAKKAKVTEEDRGPMSAGPDETKLSAPLEKADLPPKKKGFIKTSEALMAPVFLDEEPRSPVEKKVSKSQVEVTKSKKSLRKLAEESNDVDISGLLSAKTPD